MKLPSTKRLFAFQWKALLLAQLQLALLLFLAAKLGWWPVCHCAERAADPPPDPLMVDAVRWLRAREYDFCTNRAAGEFTLRAQFAESFGAPLSFVCTLATEPGSGILRGTAAFEPALDSEKLGEAFLWLATVNHAATWGHFGIDPLGRQLWFRIALFRPGLRVTPEELDRLVAEMMLAMNQAQGLFVVCPPALPPLPAPGWEHSGEEPPVSTLALDASATNCPPLSVNIVKQRTMNVNRVVPP